MNKERSPRGNSSLDQTWARAWQEAKEVREQKERVIQAMRQAAQPKQEERRA